MKLTLRFFASAAVLSLILTLIYSLPTVFNFPQASAQSVDQKTSAKQREDAYRANNLGVAQLEQFNHKEAAELFRRALTLDSQMKIAQINLAIALFNQQEIQTAQTVAQKAVEVAPERPQTHYILGLIARNQNRTEDAVASFQKVLTIDPNDVGANVNLGQIYIQQRNFNEARSVLQRALDAEPYNATAMYNLATVLLRSDAREEGQQLMTRFQALRQSGASTSIGQNYLEQGRYAEAIVSTGAESELVDKTEPKVSFNEIPVGIKNKSSITLPLPSFKPFQGKPRSKYQILKAFEGGETLIDFDGDGNLDLAKIDNTLANYQKTSPDSSTAKISAKISLYRNVGGKFTDVSISSGDLAKTVNSIGTSLVAGDFDNDNLPDLLFVGYKELRLFRNEGKGKFKDVSETAKLPKYSYLSISSAFADADHDGDLDIFIAGFTAIDDLGSEVNDFGFPNEYVGVPNLLLQNNGNGTFSDVSETAKINQSKAIEGKAAFKGKSIAVVPIDYDNRRDIDLLVLNHQAKPTLLRNLRDGSFKDAAGEVGLDAAENWSSLAVGDFNKDGFIDFFLGNVSGWNNKEARGKLAISDGNGKFIVKDAPKGTENATASQFLDYDNDGLLDLIVATSKGLLISRNLGGEFAEASAKPFKQSANFADASKILSADLDNDGDLDLIINNRFLRNEGGNANNSEIVRLQGRVSNKTGIGAKIDVRSGSLMQKLESYSASPMPAPSDIHFGLGKREKPDALRIIWTSGVIQAEVEFPDKSKTTAAKNFAPLKIEELDRKPSSCPYLYTWNGERFEFITDFLGGGEMGNWQKAGVYHYPDSDEFVRITSEQLKPKNGKYEIRVTNELEEVLFLDHLKLVAVEHDANQEVYPNEGLAIPTTGKRILYTTKNARAPQSAIDTNGKSVLPQIKNLDRVFYDNFKSQNVRGYAETHNLTLNLDDKKGFDGRTLLLLTGWTDYAFSSDNLAASQSGRSLFMPKLQVKNKRGEWETVIESIGISVGRQQTVVVDLTGKFTSDSREVRIITNFKTYWDKIEVDTSAQNSVKTIELNPAQTDLRERGFSEEIKFGEMIAANYDVVVNDGRWKYFSGNFTRTGDVKPLLNQVDDVFVISKTGDELVLSFEALPDLPKNKKYTFLLYADGYSKEMDINSGSPDAVFPLPFKRMSKYPYDENERFPMTEEKQRVYDEYTTRSVKGFLPRLESYLLK
jgi:tetratricopeptide (TPR) repeat protein